MSPLSALITGLSIGGLSCMAVQGGLLIGLLARRDQEQEEQETNTERPWHRLLLPVTAFLVAKITIHTLLGFGLGWFGESITLSTTARLWLQSFAGLVMIIAGIRIFAPHFLPWLAVNPPARMRRFIRQRAKSTALIAPAVLGLLTIFIPCGTTQAMEIQAIATGSPLQAAAIMFAFMVGTSPLFLLVGVLARGTVVFQRRLSAVAAVVVIGLGLYSMNGVLVASGSNYSVQNIFRSASVALSRESADGYQPTDDAGEATATPVIEVSGTGYTPDAITVPSGERVTLTLNGGTRLGCASSFRIPKLNLEANVPQNGSTKLTATFPNPGRYEFSCSMGMFRGVITAV